MTDQKTRKLVLASLFGALCTILTLVVQIPSPMEGYVNLGDCGVLLSAWILGPIYGGAAAGIGSMLADLLSGYAHYAPGTLVIKFTMALVAGLLFRVLGKRRMLLGQGISGIASGAVLVSGYFVFSCLWLGKGLAAAASIPGNILQAVLGLIAAAAVYSLLARNRAFVQI